MGGTLAGSITFQGLGSGTDFAAMVENLKKIESIPLNRMKLWKAEWQTRVDAFKEIMTCMEEARSSLRELSTMNKMLLRTVDSSQATVATAKADSNIDEGVYSIDVTQLATAAVFSNKKVFDSKQAKVNDTGSDKTFTYTYKGTTRELTISNNTSLEQLVTTINQDAKNPGVRATLVKSGAGYIFQIQGKETGTDATLNVESDLPGFDGTPLFSGRGVSINDTGSTQHYTYSYNGQKTTLAIPDGMTANDFVKAFNDDPHNGGLTASLVMDGSNYRIEMRDSRNWVVNLGAETDCAALGAQSGGISASTIINTSGEAKSFSFSYLGETYTANVGDNGTMQDLLDAINAQAAPAGLTASLDANGKIAFTAEDAVISDHDTTFLFKKTNSTVAIADIPKINIPAGTTLKEFADMFNKNSYAKDNGYTATLVNNGGGQSLKITQKQNGVDVDVDIFADGDPSITPTTEGLIFATDMTNLIDGTPYAMTSQKAPVYTTSTIDGLGQKPALDGKKIVVNDTGAATTFSFTDPSGASQSVNVAAGATMQDFVDAFNTQVGAASGVTAKAVMVGSGYEVRYYKTDTSGNETEVKLSNVNEGGMHALRDAGDNWYSKQATDAKFTMNGWPQELTSQTNTLTEVVEGLDITLKGTGHTDLTVTNDKEKLKENIQAAVDAINTLRSKLRELTKYDEKKETSSPEVDENTGLLKLQSQFTWQKGSTLTGNYGVQLLSTRLKNLTASSANGFVGRSNEEDMLNDLFTNWAQLGIGTVTDESDPEAGLLRIDQDKLDAALDKDIRNVAELFSSDREGSTDSSDFTVASVGTKAKGGTYDVTYDVVNGQIQNVMINGVAASSDSAYPGRYTVGVLDNPAAGLAIQFTEADLRDGSYSNTVRVKQGKVGEMIDMLSAELQPVVEGSKEKAGTIPLLIDNYSNSKSGIIASIDKKIERETVRLASWEKRQKAAYSRLDTMLSRMQQQMQKNEAALAQLGGKS